MDGSILTTIKKGIGGIVEECTDFDTEIIMHINSVFMILQQLGVGPENGFIISDKTATWRDFLGNAESKFEAVKTFMTLKVKLVFDPPASSIVVECIKENIRELEWRLLHQTEENRKEGIQNG